MQQNKKAILLSGGMDSIALAYWMNPEVAITLDYGQRAAEAEITAASQVANILGMEHHVLRIDCSSLGSGDLVGTTPIGNAPVSEWWPYRCSSLRMVAIQESNAGNACLDEGYSIGCLRVDGGQC